MVRRPRGLLRVMLAPLRSKQERDLAHPGREPREFRRRLGVSFACYAWCASNRSCRLAAVGGSTAWRPTTDASARGRLRRMTDNGRILYTAHAHVTRGRAPRPGPPPTRPPGGGSPPARGGG